MKTHKTRLSELQKRQSKMKIYKVKIKDGGREQTIKAKSELEARVLFCEKNNLLYRHLAGKLEVRDQTGQTRRDRENNNFK